MKQLRKSGSNRTYVVERTIAIRPQATASLIRETTKEDNGVERTGESMRGEERSSYCDEGSEETSLYKYKGMLATLSGGRLGRRFWGEFLNNETRLLRYRY